MTSIYLYCTYITRYRNFDIWLFIIINFREWRASVSFQTWKNWCWNIIWKYGHFFGICTYVFWVMEISYFNLLAFHTLLNLLNRFLRYITNKSLVTECECVKNECKEEKKLQWNSFVKNNRCIFYYVLGSFV